MSAAFIFAAVSSAFAQGNGIGGITEATNMVTSYFDPGVWHEKSCKWLCDYSLNYWLHLQFRLQ